jgi:hypothetical protein
MRFYCAEEGHTEVGTHHVSATAKTNVHEEILDQSEPMPTQWGHMHAKKEPQAFQKKEHIEFTLW